MALRSLQQGGLMGFGGCEGFRESWGWWGWWRFVLHPCFHWGGKGQGQRQEHREWLPRKHTYMLNK